MRYSRIDTERAKAFVFRAILEKLEKDPTDSVLIVKLPSLLRVTIGDQTIGKRYSKPFASQAAWEVLKKTTSKKALKLSSKDGGITRDHVIGTTLAAKILLKKLKPNFTQKQFDAFLNEHLFNWFVTKKENQRLRSAQTNSKNWVEAYKKCGITHMVNIETQKRVSIAKLVNDLGLKSPSIF
jgi:hypothetical protein